MTLGHKTLVILFWKGGNRYFILEISPVNSKIACARQQRHRNFQPVEDSDLCMISTWGRSLQKIIYWTEFPLIPPKPRAPQKMSVQQNRILCSLEARSSTHLASATAARSSSFFTLLMLAFYVDSSLAGRPHSLK